MPGSWHDPVAGPPQPAAGRSATINAAYVDKRTGIRKRFMVLPSNYARRDPTQVSKATSGPPTALYGCSIDATDDDGQSASSAVWATGSGWAIATGRP